MLIVHVCSQGSWVGSDNLFQVVHALSQGTLEEPSSGATDKISWTCVSFGLAGKDTDKRWIWGSKLQEKPLSQISRYLPTCHLSVSPSCLSVWWAGMVCWLRLQVYVGILTLWALQTLTIRFIKGRM